MVVTVSAGNDGTEGAGSIGHLCTSKNVICVGGVDSASVNNVFQDCLWDGVAGCGGANDLGSARGPVATSNRIKPDILGYMANSASVGGEFMAGNRPAAMCQTDAPGTKIVYWDWQNNNGFEAPRSRLPRRLDLPPSSGTTSWPALTPPERRPLPTP